MTVAGRRASGRRRTDADAAFRVSSPETALQETGRLIVMSRSASIIVTRLRRAVFSEHMAKVTDVRG